MGNHRSERMIDTAQNLFLVVQSLILFARMSCSTNGFGVTTTIGKGKSRQSCRMNSFGTTICD